MAASRTSITSRGRPSPTFRGKRPRYRSCVKGLAAGKRRASSRVAASSRARRPASRFAPGDGSTGTSFSRRGSC
jgi:hypothetical protein